jgi:glycosyltransferase involved in cell wall biosynthesis
VTRTAIVWHGTTMLTAMTLRLDLYAADLTARGHEVRIYCREGLETGFAGPVSTFAEDADLTAVSFWRSIAADHVILVTFLRLDDVLAAAREAGHRITAIAESDGQVSLKLFFGFRFRRDWRLSSTRRERARLVWYYLKLFLGRWRRSDQVFIRSAELSDSIVFATEGARRNFERCLLLHGRSDLVSKLRVEPYPIDPVFLAPAHEPRKRRAVAIGRWDGPEKRADLLARAISRYLDSGGDWEFAIVGRGGERAFAPVSQRFPRCRYVGPLSVRQVAELLRTSQVLLCTSLWESGPIVAFEALASGCTIVSTPLPTVASLVQGGRSGTMSRSHRVSSFVEAMKAEFREWDESRRRPMAVGEPRA